MSFIRPEVQVQLWRWREVIAAVLLVCIGLRWAVTGLGLVMATGWALIAVAVVMGVVGAQRMRFRGCGHGPGVVQVLEGQISYFGPLTGGAIAVSELERVRLDHTAKPAHWLLEQQDRGVLAIPVTARGAEDLFDVFAALPGLKTERMLAELHRSGPHQVVIWQRAGAEPAQVHLH